MDRDVPPAAAGAERRSGGETRIDPRHLAACGVPVPQPRDTTRTRGAGDRSFDGVLLTVLCTAQFMLVLDVSVTNVALASIQRSLHFTPTALQWIITAYTLVFGGLLIFFGRVGDLWGRRRLFLAGLAVFTVASLACGLAQSPAQLIAFRGLQGVGGAMVSPVALSLLTTNFAEGRPRNTALGVWGAIAAGGAAAGMIIGGVLSDAWTWRSVFFINVPIGVALAAAAVRWVPESRGAGGRLDVAGAAAVTGGLIALVYAVAEAQPRGLGDPVVLGAFLLAAVLLLGFVAIEARARSPLLPFSLLRIRNVSSANVVSLLASAVIVAQSYFLSLYLREVLDYSPLRTGLALLPITATVVLVAGLIPKLVPAVGVRTVLVVGGLLLGAGMVLQSRMPARGNYLDVLPGLVVTAAGLGCSFVASTIAATAGVDASMQGVASGLLNTTQQIGGAVGLAALAAVAAARTSQLAGTTAQIAALNAGFQRAFLVAAGFAAAAALVAGLGLPGRAKLPTAPPSPTAP